ncbi:hypothetical protein EZS27_023299 [termite gut metagenome]|uniref:Uncharacterized protein n=1 Tax=termite gut metagenome TaxID=433724 RepID=A0A5J4R0X3_9ZZZZ
MKKILNFKTLALTALLFGAFGCQQDEYEIDYLVDYVYVGQVQDHFTGEAISKEVTITYDGLKTPIKAETDGTFLIPNLKPGSHEFRFSAEGYTTALHKATVIIDNYGQVTSPKKGAHSNQLQTIDFPMSLYPSVAELVGYVYHAEDINGITTPYEGAKVVFEASAEYDFVEKQYEATTDAEGYYRITNLPKGISDGRATLKAYSGDKLLGSPIRTLFNGMESPALISTTQEITSYYITEGKGAGIGDPILLLSVLSTNFVDKTLARGTKLYVTFNKPVSKDEIIIELSINDRDTWQVQNTVTPKETDNKTLVIDLAATIPASTLLYVRISEKDNSPFYTSGSFSIK